MEKVNEDVKIGVEDNMIPPEEMAIINEADASVLQFQAFMNGENSVVIIRTEEEYTKAQLVVAEVKNCNKKLLGSKETVVTPVYKIYEAKLAVYSPRLKALKEKIDALEAAGRAYRKKADEEAAEKQRQAEVEAEEIRRKAAEQAEKANKKAEEYREAGREDKAAEWDGKAQKAEDVATSIVAPIVKPNIPVSFRGGFNTQKRYAAKILKVAELLEHFKKATPPDVLEAMQRWCDAQARAAKGTASTIPGVEFIEK